MMKKLLITYAVLITTKLYGGGTPQLSSDTLELSSSQKIPALKAVPKDKEKKKSKKEKNKELTRFVKKDGKIVKQKINITNDLPNAIPLPSTNGPTTPLTIENKPIDQDILRQLNTLNPANRERYERYGEATQKYWDSLAEPRKQSRMQAMKLGFLKHAEEE